MTGARILFTPDDEVGPQDAHGSDADARLGCSVRRAEACKDDGGRATHGTEEGLRVWVSWDGPKGILLEAASEQAVTMRRQSSQVELTAYVGLEGTQ